MSDDNRNRDYGTYEVVRTTRILFLSAQWAQFILGILLVPIFLILFGETGLSLIAIVGGSAYLYRFLAIRVSRLLYSVNQRRAHNRRSDLASSVLSDLSAGIHRSFCLYLRPFITSRGLRVPNSRFGSKFFPSIDKFYGRRIDLETVYAMSLEHQEYPLIAIGETGFKLGAGKVPSSDEEWRTVFARLSQHATLIIMVPLPKPSTLWEIDYMFAHRSILEKSLFVMPMRLRSLVPERLERYWEEVRDRMFEQGIQLPELNPYGGFIFFRDGGTTMHILNSGGFNIDYIDQVLLGFINRQRADEIFQALPINLQEALPNLFEALIHKHPETLALAARPIPLHVLAHNDHVKELALALSRDGIIAIHRQQDGLQAWLEVNFHPMFLDWVPLQLWAEENQEALQIKGKLVMSVQRYVAQRRQMLDTSASPVLSQRDSGRISEIETVPFAPKISSNLLSRTGTLRPEEHVFLQRDLDLTT
jgi:hypothetical protein